MPAFRPAALKMLRDDCISQRQLNFHHLMTRTILLLLLFFLTACESKPPNVVLILVDDLGWMDTHVYGSTFYETPNIDRLGAEGTRFTQFYASSPVCSPTRASIMTGKHPARLQITNWIGGTANARLLQADYRPALPPEEITLGDTFLEAGYHTAYIGKWHLGTADARPENQGFQTVLATNDAGQPGSYFAPYIADHFPASNVPDLDLDPDSTYLTTRLTDLAVDFIKSNQGDSFFLVLSHYGVHTPLQAKPIDIERFQTNLPTTYEKEAYGGSTRTSQNSAVYAAMIASVDESVGNVFRALEELEMQDNTIIIFTSDNGGLSTLSEGRTWAPTSNLPLRAGKGWLYEGGIRIPLIIHTPQQVPAIVDRMGSTDDLYPTITGLAGITSSGPVDGINLFRTPTSERTLYWHFPHYHGSANRPSGAIRFGKYKLIEWFEDHSVELYDLESDPEEAIDISDSEPGITADLLQQLRTWRDTVDAQMPRPNPDYSESSDHY